MRPLPILDISRLRDIDEISNFRRGLNNWDEQELSGGHTTLAHIAASCDATNILASIKSLEFSLSIPRARPLTLGKGRILKNPLPLHLAAGGLHVSATWFLVQDFQPQGGPDPWTLILCFVEVGAVAVNAYLKLTESVQAPSHDEGGEPQQPHGSRNDFGKRLSVILSNLESPIEKLGLLPLDCDRSFFKLLLARRLRLSPFSVESGDDLSKIYPGIW